MIDKQLHYFLFSILLLLTADDGVPGPGAGLPADPGPVTKPDPPLLALVLSDLAGRELRLVPGEDDGVGGQAGEPALRGVCRVYRFRDSGHLGP